MKFDQQQPVTQLDAAKLQIAILEVLACEFPIQRSENCESYKGTGVQDVTKRIGLKDLHEVQRYLYILEGQQMVSPVPTGDLTSNQWTITVRGHNALEKLRHVLIAA